MISFKYNGVDSSTYGVYITDAPEFTTAETDTETVDVQGFGELSLFYGGRKDTKIDLECFIRDMADYDKAVAWLSADGSFHDLVLSNDSTKARKARIDGEIEAEHVSRSMASRTMRIPMRIKPYRYEAEPTADIVIAETATPITNIGTIASAPLLVVSGSGDGTLMIGDSTMIFTGMTEAITVDCDAKFAYTGSGTTRVLATQYITGDWIEIDTGIQYVSFTGGITGVTITPRWRWL